VLLAECTASRLIRGAVQAWHLTGDVYSTKAGMKPWISEMYGYSFAAARHGMWHQIDRLSMLYPSYVPATPARLMHYGLGFKIEGQSTSFSFDKHEHWHFDALACSVSSQGKDLAGLLPMPPAVDDLISPEVRVATTAFRRPRSADVLQLLQPHHAAAALREQPHSSLESARVVRCVAMEGSNESHAGWAEALGRSPVHRHRAHSQRGFL